MLLDESSMAPEVAAARGYRTVRKKADLKRLGFAESQRNPPGLLIPIHGPAGGVVLYQFRPDEPRINNKTGKRIKYETLAGAVMRLDAHPSVRERLEDPSVPLFVTEGIKKGDSLASQGLCAVSLIGVWNWRGTNPKGGKTALKDWEDVALNGRRVYVVFDSDVMLKIEVYAALSRLKEFLKGRGAKVAFIYLPAGEGGRKQGVDDYLAAGNTPDDLLSLATSELRGPPREEDAEPDCPYRLTPGGLVWDKPTQNGPVPTPLTNFSAKIVRDVSEDDGADPRRRFEIEATMNGRRETFSVPSGQFAAMGWATEHLGAGAIVYPGFGARDHARTAVQMLSKDVPAERVYAHTGWREIGGEWVYLHAGGAISHAGRTEGVRTELSGVLEGRALPDPDTADLTEAVRASLRFLDVAPERITVPLLAATYRAPLGDSDFGVHVSGPTGEGKSELAALCQQHYGEALDARNLASWESTENAIEGQAFLAKDQIMVLDDFAPTGTSYDVQRWHKKADRVLRAKGNAAGRQRMRSDTTLRPEKRPRALFISTGEDVPRGQSLRARMAVLEIGPRQLDWGRLTARQKDAARGVYALSMSGYVRWLAGRHGEIRSGLWEERAALREAASESGGQHRRTPAIVADLALGLRYFLRYAHEAGAIGEAEAEELWALGWAALGSVAAAQRHHQAAGEPVRRFSELLSAAIASGRAHVASPSGGEPRSPGAWGWRSQTVGSGEYEREEWKPQGERVGWIGGEDLYLEPEAAYAAAQRHGRDSGDALTVTGRTLRKRLHERGALLSTGKESEGRETLTVRRTLGGRRQDVLHTSKDFISPDPEEPDQPDHGGQEPDTYADWTPTLWSGSRSGGESRPDHAPNGQVANSRWSDTKREPDQENPHKHRENAGVGQVGQVENDAETHEKSERRGARTAAPDEAGSDDHSGWSEFLRGVSDG